MRGGVAIAVALLTLGVCPAGASAALVAPQPHSQPLYGVGGPVPATVAGVDGDRLHVDTWLPVAKDGHAPPARVPVVVMYGPYFTPGEARSAALEQLVSRGYAFAQAHVPGTGGSTGCYAQGGRVEQADGARIVAHLARAAFSDGGVALLGLSYAGGTALEVAASPERDLVAPLRAVISLSATASLYDFFHHDGVPHALQSLGSTGYDALVNGFETGRSGALADPAGRVLCQPEQLAAVADTSGDKTPYYRARDLRRQIRRISVPTFAAHGHADPRVGSHALAGVFDRLRDGVPRSGMFGFWGHEPPPVAQFDPMVVAWLDRWVKGLPTGAEDWPVAQVQASDGTWYARSDWPRPPRTRELELQATGDPSYVEAVPEVRDGLLALLPGARATFESGPLDAPAVLDGMARLNASVVLGAPDAHMTAVLEALDGAGRPTGSRTIAMRSLRHLAPYRRGGFAQAHGRPAPVGRPVRVRLRFDPTSLVVPAGGRLRVTLAGSVIAYDGLEGAVEGGGALLAGPSLTAGAPARVEVLGRPALRFATP